VVSIYAAESYASGGRRYSASLPSWQEYNAVSVFRGGGCV
jgi:hypothetical protein